MRHTHRTVAATAALLLILSGCGSKFTRKNFESIRNNVDTHDSVREKIGDPDSALSDNGQWYFEHPDEHYGALVNFDERSGTVKSKMWLDDPGTGGRPSIWKELGVK